MLVTVVAIVIHQAQVTHMVCLLSVLDADLLLDYLFYVSC